MNDPPTTTFDLSGVSASAVTWLPPPVAVGFQSKDCTVRCADRGEASPCYAADICEGAARSKRLLSFVAITAFVRALKPGENDAMTAPFVGFSATARYLLMPLTLGEIACSVKPGSIR